MIHESDVGEGCGRPGDVMFVSMRMYTPSRRFTSWSKRLIHIFVNTDLFTFNTL